MSCKYDIIEEGGRKRVRALRHFTVQGRDVCPMELGGYVYDEKTLSQDGNCWIFSGSLEYPGVRVLDEAIVDMGNNLATASSARPEKVIISGNSRVMGAISFETQSFGTVQTPAMFEQGGYTSNTGSVPVKVSDGSRVRIPMRLFGGTVGSVAITNPLYAVRVTYLGEDGLVTGTSGAWIEGGPEVTVPITAPYFLVEVRKTAITALTPTDVTAAGVTITQAREATVRIFNSSIVPVYNGSVTVATSILRYAVNDPSGKPYQVSIQNSYLRIECTFNATNTVRASSDFIKVNYNLVLTPNAEHYVSGIFRNTNINTPASVGVATANKVVFDVSDCPAFEYSTVVFPDLTAMYAANKTFYFKQCNMPVGSAIHYYDPKVNVWDNIDFTKAMADLGKALANNANIVLVSSNKQGWYRVFGKTSKSLGALVEALSSINGANLGELGDSYDTVIYKDHEITGTYHFKGRNVLGGTQGGASRLVNKTGAPIVIDGNFRIEGNAQVTDTPLKGNGYIGGNAELKNGNVEGYIYLQDNAKYIPAVVENPPAIRRLIMSGNTKVLKQRNAASGLMNLVMSDNAILDAAVGFVGDLIMMGDSRIVRADMNSAATIYGRLVLKDRARIEGTASVDTRGEITLVGNFAAPGARTIYGKRVLSDVSQIAVVDVPPTKTTW